MEFFQLKELAQNNNSISLPLYEAKVQAGFPSVADDYTERTLNLDEHLISSPSSTFFVRVTGNSMIKAGIYEGSLLVVDRLAKATNNKIVIAFVNGEFTVKRYRTMNGLQYLLPENDDFKPTLMSEGSHIWGVVTAVINKL